MRIMNKYICCIQKDVAEYLCTFYKFILQSGDIFYFQNELINTDKVPNLNNLEIFFTDKLRLTF